MVRWGADGWGPTEGQVDYTPAINLVGGHQMTCVRRACMRTPKWESLLNYATVLRACLVAVKS
eukprot:scaffold168490_cov13-Tisochrysis_lutea.AAC.1